jgi:hypothetical protein
MLKKILATTILVSLIGFEANASAPYFCNTGKSSTGLTAEAPTHVAIGVSTQFKGDYNYTLPPKEQWVTFNSDKNGFMGDAITNSDSNAYIHETFYYSDRGESWFWVFEDGDMHGDSCSSDKFYIQNLPTISNNYSAKGGRSITTKVSGYIDNDFSERGLAGLGPKITLKYYNIDTGDVFYEYPTSANHTFYTNCKGEYKITAFVSDGNFSKSQIITDGVYYTGGKFCGTVR